MHIFCKFCDAKKFARNTGIESSSFRTAETGTVPQMGLIT